MSRLTGVCACLIVLLAGCADEGAEQRSASVCFNAEMYKPGASIISVYRRYRADSDSEISAVDGPDFVTSISVSGPVDFKGTKVFERSVSSGSAYVSGTRNFYFTLDGLVVVDYGVSSLAGDPANPTIGTRSYSPPLRSATTNFSLQVGESINEDFVYSLSGATATESSSLSQTFVGFEDVSTPAGVFRQACHFAFPSESEGVDTTTHVWIARTSGIEIKRSTVVFYTYGGVPATLEVRYETQQLVLATLNGVLVSP